MRLTEFEGSDNYGDEYALTAVVNDPATRNPWFANPARSRDDLQAQTILFCMCAEEACRQIPQKGSSCLQGTWLDLDGSPAVSLGVCIDRQGLMPEIV